MDANEGGIFDLGAVKFLGVFEEEKLPGVIGGGIWIERAYPGIHEVMGRDWFTGGPDCIRAQVKGENAHVWRDFPTIGQAGDAPAGLWIEAGQAFEHGEDDATI